MTRIWIRIRQVIKESAQLYFAPVTGAIRGIKHEYRRIDREHRNARKALEKEINHRP